MLKEHYLLSLKIRYKNIKDKISALHLQSSKTLIHWCIGGSASASI